MGLTIAVVMAIVVGVTGMVTIVGVAAVVVVTIVVGGITAIVGGWLATATFTHGCVCGEWFS